MGTVGKPRGCADQRAPEVICTWSTPVLKHLPQKEPGVVVHIP